MMYVSLMSGIVSTKDASTMYCGCNEWFCKYHNYFCAVSDKSDFIDQLCQLCLWWQRIHLPGASFEEYIFEEYIYQELALATMYLKSIFTKS